MRIGFIGGGNMASALIGGVINSGLTPPENIIVCDILEQRRTLLQKEFFVQVSDSAREVVKSAKTVVLAVKPQNLEGVATEIGGLFTSDQILISILAGKPRSAIIAALGQSVRLVRAMPNLPALVGAAITAIAQMPEDIEAQATASSILSTVGKVIVVPEDLMDPVTALSGSGPGYVFYLIEAFVQGGVELGFSAEEALRLTVETFSGSCKLLLERSAEPSELRRQVTSPGGTTAAGLSAFDAGGLKGTIAQGLLAANQRAKELSTPDTK
ncbi:MAG TPA: pyrroline-5-carboxylate reductase [bacterium]|nr:pyrroline-5-carboxylate reductase [bacterium]